MDGSSKGMLHVAAGVIRDGAGRILLAQRQAGQHMAGGWEFPGGKVADGETVFAALVRELREELDIDVYAATPLIRYPYTYPERTVLLDVWMIDAYAGEPRSVEGQPLRWEVPGRLGEIGLLEADRPIIEALRQLPATGAAQHMAS